jgi:hypothetical protein
MEDMKFWEGFEEKLKDPEYKKQFFLQSLATSWVDNNKDDVLD